VVREEDLRLDVLAHVEHLLYYNQLQIATSNTALTKVEEARCGTVNSSVISMDRGTDSKVLDEGLAGI
jgi:hypothetical protein